MNDTHGATQIVLFRVSLLLRVWASMVCRSLLPKRLYALPSLTESAQSKRHG